MHLIVKVFPGGGHSHMSVDIKCLSIDPLFKCRSYTQWPPFFHFCIKFYMKIAIFCALRAHFEKFNDFVAILTENLQILAWNCTGLQNKLEHLCFTKHKYQLTFDPRWPLHDFWPQQFSTLELWRPQLTPVWPLPNECITLSSGDFFTKFGSHKTCFTIVWPLTLRPYLWTTFVQLRQWFFWPSLMITTIKFMEKSYFKTFA